MIEFPNCKINLGLSITSKRPDGYHNLETVFYPLSFCDVLEVLKSGLVQKPALALYGMEVAGDPDQNLCIKAWHLLKADFPQLPPVDIFLYKKIPIGAGLGGGSADGAFMLRILNEKFGLGLDTAQLCHYALKLGSDCPFFIINKPVFASGRGEIMEPVPLSLAGFYILLINPGIHISTPYAFSRITPAQPAFSPRALHQVPVQEWKQILINDFEQPIFEEYPLLATIKDDLYKAGAVYAQMSGSGSTMFGIFEKEPSQISKIFPAEWMVLTIKA